MRPLVVTLVLDAASHEALDALRRAHFPPERLVVGAHLTLFHALPGEQEETVRGDLADAARRPPFDLGVPSLQRLGRGVAYGWRSAELTDLHRALQQVWAPWLTPQDARPLSPHVTVQNKVAPEQARRLHEALDCAPPLPPATAEGLALWRYEGGPWTPLAQERFSG